MEKIYVVIGGCAAGMSAATQIRRREPNAKIVVFEKTKFVSYGSCGIPFYISGEIKDPNSLIVYTPEHFRKVRKIDVYTQTLVEKINTSTKTVEAKNLETGEKILQEYHRLILATGGTPKRAVPLKKNVFRVRNLEDGINLKNYLNEKIPKRVAVIGSGFLGLEMSEAFRKLGMQVFLFEKMSRVLPQFDEEISKIVEKELISNNVSVFKGVAVEFASESEKIIANFNNTHIEVDFVLDAVGVSPEVELINGTSIETGKTGAVSVNDRLQTADPSIFAAGDCIEVKHILTGEKIYIPQGTTANKTGRIAGINASGGSEIFEGVLGTSITKVFSLHAAKTGLGEEEAKKIFPDVEVETSTSLSKAHYYPGAEKIFTKLIFSKANGQILGAQMVGKDGVGKRIDIFATIIYAKMQLKEASRLDLSYNPSVAPVWDPVLRAINKARQKAEV